MNYVFEQGKIGDFREGPMHERNAFALPSPTLQHKKIYAAKVFSGVPEFPTWARDTWTGQDALDIWDRLTTSGALDLSAGDTYNTYGTTRYLQRTLSVVAPVALTSVPLTVGSVTYGSFASWDQQSGFNTRRRMTVGTGPVYEQDDDIQFAADGTITTSPGYGEGIDVGAAGIDSWSGGNPSFILNKAYELVVTATTATFTKSADWIDWSKEPEDEGYSTPVEEVWTVTLSSEYTLDDCYTDAQAMLATLDFAGAETVDYFVWQTSQSAHNLDVGFKWVLRYEPIAGLSPEMFEGWCTFLREAPLSTVDEISGDKVVINNFSPYAGEGSEHYWPWPFSSEYVGVPIVFLSKSLFYSTAARFGRQFALTLMSESTGIGNSGTDSSWPDPPDSTDTAPYATSTWVEISESDYIYSDWGKVVAVTS